MTRGFVIMAFGDPQYQHCAKVLAESIVRLMPTEKVSLITDKPLDNSGVYDKVIVLDDVDGGNWKLANDWQVYNASPYDLTIKLEADIYLTRPIDHWWKVMESRDLNICTTIRNYRNEISEENFYRKTIVESGLPNTYNAITYFKKSPLAERFFTIVRDVFENWDQYHKSLKYSSEDRATTDVAYALATLIIGQEHCTMPNFTDFSMIHMKKMVSGTKSSDWTEELVTEIHAHSLRINTIPQMYPLHYHVKKFAQEIEDSIND